MTVCQKVPKSDFQNEFAMPRVIQIIPIKDNLFILFTKLPLIMFIFGQVSYFLGPTIEKIPQPY